MNPVGRPPKYKNPAEMERIINLYFLACKQNTAISKGLDSCLFNKLTKGGAIIANSIEDCYPSISGIAYLLGMTTECFRTYAENEKFSATVKRAKQRVEMSLEQRLAGTAVTGSIFSLKNNFGWVDKKETQMSGVLNLNDVSGKTDEELEAIVSGKTTT